MFIVILEEYCAFSKDYEFASDHFDTAAKILDTFLVLKSANGLVPAFSDPAYWNFYEWSDGLDGARTNERNRELSYDAPLNAFLSAALRSFSWICDMLGKKSESSFYMQAHKTLNESINSVFWSETAECYASFYCDDKLAHFSELTLSLLSFCNAVPDIKTDRILELLSSKNSPLIPISLSHSIFKYDALMKRKARYGQYVLEDIRSKWGRMIEKGATTFWETEEGADAFDFAGSLCHGWSAVPVYIFGKYFTENSL
jgi:glycogen debranching enzyme